MTDQITPPEISTESKIDEIISAIPESVIQIETSPLPAAAESIKKKRCRMCRITEDVETYVNLAGNVRVNLCPNHKDFFGAQLKLWVPPVDFKAIKAKSEAHRKAIDAALPSDICEYPACKSTNVKLYHTRTPNPKNGQAKGRYCSFHANLLNSMHRFLPYAWGRCTEYMVETVICHRELEVKDVARKFEVPPDSVVTVLRTLLTLINPHDAILEGYSLIYPPAREVAS